MFGEEAKDEVDYKELVSNSDSEVGKKCITFWSFSLYM